MVLMAFDFMKVNFDIDRQRYEEKCRINAENGRNGGKAKASKSKRPLATASKIKRSPPKEEEDVNEYEEENKKELEIKIEWYKEMNARKKFYIFLLWHIHLIEEKLEIDKIDAKLKEFVENLWDKRATLELESFCDHHKKEKTLFKSTILRLNTWLSNKIK